MPSPALGGLCQTLCVSAKYHPDFWVAVAAAAPVIALGGVVAYGPLTDTRRKAWSSARTALVAKGESPILTRIPEEFGEAIRWCELAMWVTTTNIVAQIVAMGLALTSLLVGSDNAPVLCLVILGGGIALLAAHMVIVSLAERIIENEKSGLTPLGHRALDLDPDTPE